MARKRTFTLIIVLLVLGLLPGPLIIILNRQLIDTPGHLAAIDCGIIAYVWWLAITALATRPRWLANRIGLPTLYLLHGIVGILALIAATIHKFATFSMFPMIKNVGNVAWGLEIFLISYAVFFLSGWLVDRWAVLQHFKAWLEDHFLKHQVTLWLHRLNLVAIALIWLHVQLIDRVHVPGFMLVFNVYTVVALVIYLAWKIHPTNIGGIISSNQSVDGDVQKLSIQLNASQAQYYAGDFYFLTIHQPGFSREAHPYSVANVPQPGQLAFNIQRRGDDTTHLVYLPVGVSVRLAGPYGLFSQQVEQASGPVILYGLGTGLAPLLSLAGEYGRREAVHLLWTSSAVGAPFYQQLLNQLADTGVTIDMQKTSLYV